MFLITEEKVRVVTVNKSYEEEYSYDVTSEWGEEEAYGLQAVLGFC